MFLIFVHLLYLGRGDPWKLFKINHRYIYIDISFNQWFKFAEVCTLRAPIVVRCSFPLLCQGKCLATHMQILPTWHPYHWSFCTKIVAVAWVDALHCVVKGFLCFRISASSLFFLYLQKLIDRSRWDDANCTSAGSALGFIRLDASSHFLGVLEVTCLQGWNPMISHIKHMFLLSRICFSYDVCDCVFFRLQKVHAQRHWSIRYTGTMPLSSQLVGPIGSTVAVCVIWGTWMLRQELFERQWCGPMVREKCRTINILNLHHISLKENNLPFTSMAWCTKCFFSRV